MFHQINEETLSTDYKDCAEFFLRTSGVETEVAMGRGAISCVDLCPICFRGSCKSQYLLHSGGVQCL